jgi:UDP:flavonoid glycosyltransferase YjiC (YdhE family)
MARFLFATMPIVGHVAPIAPVARELINRGHEVTWYTSKHFEDKITATGATFAPLVSPIDFGDGEYSKHFPGRNKYQGLRQVAFDFEHAFVGSVEGYVHDLRALVSSFKPDALVVDPAVAAGVIMSIVDNLPTATINITVLSLGDAYQAPFGLGLPPSSSLLGRLRNKALYPVVDHVIFRRVNRAYAALARKHDWPYHPFRPKATEFLFIQPSVESFEYPSAVTAPQVHFVGPLIPELPPDVQRPDWWADLEAAKESGRSVVLVTQGTIATDSTELIEPTLRAMEFEDVFVIAAGADPAALSDIPANARVERFVPFGPLNGAHRRLCDQRRLRRSDHRPGQRGARGQRGNDGGQSRSGWTCRIHGGRDQSEDQSADGRTAADGHLLRPPGPVLSAAGRGDTARSGQTRRSGGGRRSARAIGRDQEAGAALCFINKRASTAPGRPRVFPHKARDAATPELFQRFLWPCAERRPPEGRSAPADSG